MLSYSSPITSPSPSTSDSNLRLTAEQEGEDSPSLVNSLGCLTNGKKEKRPHMGIASIGSMGYQQTEKGTWGPGGAASPQSESAWPAALPKVPDHKCKNNTKSLPLWSPHRPAAMARTPHSLMGPMGPLFLRDFFPQIL